MKGSLLQKKMVKILPLPDKQTNEQTADKALAQSTDKFAKQMAAQREIITICRVLFKVRKESTKTIMFRKFS